eukprot:6393791-Lingulodinium_polyedra.AAC.1
MECGTSAKAGAPMMSKYVTRASLATANALKELKDLVGAAQGGDLMAPSVFSKEAIDKHVRRM